jgi:hypothetical protein
MEKPRESPLFVITLGFGLMVIIAQGINGYYDAKLAEYAVRLHPVTEPITAFEYQTATICAKNMLRTANMSRLPSKSELTDAEFFCQKTARNSA